MAIKINDFTVFFVCFYTTMTKSRLEYIFKPLKSNETRQWYPEAISLRLPLLDSLVVECWLWVREVPCSIPSQGPRHTKDVIKMVPVVPLFGTQHYKKRNTGSFSRIRIVKKCNGLKSGIEILWSRRSLADVAGMKKLNDHAEPTKVE